MTPPLNVLQAQAIVSRTPNKEDADDLGYVQYFDDRGFWSIRYWYNVALHNQPWLHTTRKLKERECANTASTQVEYTCTHPQGCTCCLFHGDPSPNPLCAWSKAET